MAAKGKRMWCFYRIFCSFTALNPWELINGKLNILVLKLHIFDVASYILCTYWNWLSLSGLVEVNGAEGMVLMGGEMTQNGMTDDKAQIWREIMFMLWGMTNIESAETAQMWVNRNFNMCNGWIQNILSHFILFANAEGQKKAQKW